MCEAIESCLPKFKYMWPSINWDTQGKGGSLSVQVSRGSEKPAEPVRCQPKGRVISLLLLSGQSCKIFCPLLVLGPSLCWVWAPALEQCPSPPCRDTGGTQAQSFLGIKPWNIFHLEHYCHFSLCIYFLLSPQQSMTESHAGTFNCKNKNNFSSHFLNIFFLPPNRV